MTNNAQETRAGRPWLLWTFGAVLALFGLAMAAGGVWLVVLGGSWYYLLAGAGMLIAGVELMRGRMAGAWWYAAVFAGTLFWTTWEAGLDYWRWIPRFGLIVAFAFILALLLPKLERGPSPAVARSVAVLLALVFISFFALAFLPHGVTRADWSRSSPDSGAAEPASADDTFAQPADAPVDGDWAAYGRSNAAMRYSPLTRIDRENVETLERAWVYRTGDLPEHRWGAETTPIKVDDTVYLCSARNIMIALEASSGEELWRYDPAIDDEWIPYTAACRGVTYYEIPAGSTAGAGACGARIFEGTLDGRLIAVSAETGQPCAGFGENGQVDIKRGMGRTLPGMVSITSPPVVVRGVLVTGHQVLDGQRRDAPSGVIQGFDAITGEQRWAWDMGKPDLDRRPAEGETYTRGTPNMWTIASSDEALGLVYLPMGNSAVDYWSGSRSARENEYSTALVALDATTGEPAWHFQTAHVDVWDYDLGSTATLVDFPMPNGVVPAIILPSKQGDMYVLDRRTGEPVIGVEERPVPQGGVEPEERTPTQPYSLYHTLQRPPLSVRDMWGMSPLDQLFCRIQFRQSVYAGMYTPPTADTHYVQYSGYNGGSDWGGIAVDPRRGVIVANYNDMPNHNRLVPREEAEKAGYAPRSELARGQPGGAEGAGDPQLGAPYAIDVNAGWRVPVTRLLCKQPPYGGIRAIDLATGRTIWDRPFGLARANGPFGIPSMLPILIGTPNNGGSVVTASGLIFIAASTDNLVRAIDLETGETLWKDVLPAGGQAGPMVYEADGRQYLVIVAAGHHFMETPSGDYVVAYALPE